MEKLHTHAERKSEIIERLKEKVETVKEVLLKMEELFIVSPDEAIVKLSEFKEEYLASLNESELGILLSREELILKLEDLRRRHDLEEKRCLQDPELDGEDSEELARIKEELVNAYDEEVKMAENQDLSLHLAVLSGIDNLKAKSQTVKDFKGFETAKSLFEARSSNLEEEEKSHLEFNPADIVHTETDGVSITLVIKDSEFHKYAMGGDPLGFFIPGTPYICIKESEYGGANKENTIDHERKHLVLDGLIPYHIDTERFVKHLTRLETFAQKNVGFFVDREMERFARVGYVAEVINSLHNEFLAEYNNALDKNFGEFKISREMLLAMIFNPDLDERTVDVEVGRSVRALSTAGNEFRKVLNSFAKTERTLQEKGMDDKALVIKDLSTQLKMRFARIIRSLRSTASYAAMTQNKEAVLDMEALVHILPPSKFEHIAIYLESQYEEVEIEDEDDDSDWMDDDMKEAIRRSGEGSQ